MTRSGREALGSATFRDAEQRLNGYGNAFQRLDHTAPLFVDAGYLDLRAASIRTGGSG
ncbi:hypothetical protein [Dactylosporangium darangshiense]|uniref:Uncharacterized protein n=1 Tax=Dactylosporangium darangshiense TaxID=579108 RepID=A0ABP8DNE4_9ACTN